MPINPYNKYIKQYQTSNITTATPEKLMIMLFDGAIQFLQKAKAAIEEKNLQERSVNLESARKIIRELMRTIDLENGNDVSKSLFRLYNKMAMKLIKANVSKNVTLVDEVIEDLMNIRWGFQKAIEIESGVSSIEDVMKEQAQQEQVQQSLIQQTPVQQEITEQNHESQNADGGSENAQ